MREILYEILEEAREGKVKIDGEEWPVGFNSKIEDGASFFREDHNACLTISNLDDFLELLQEYVSLELKENRKLPHFFQDEERNQIKWIITYFFVNSTTEDFLNPMNHLRRRISFLKDDTFSNLEDGVSVPLGENFFYSNLEVENSVSSIQQETPFVMKISLSSSDGRLHYFFPSIYYGIAVEDGEKICYLYSILNKRKSSSLEEEKYQSKINRLLFQLNRDVKNLEEFHSDLESNIRDVSMSFVFSLHVFLSLLQKGGIECVRVVPYLPLRYHSRELFANCSPLGETLHERNDSIQMNLTNKLIRTFRRLSYQNGDIKIIHYPYEIDEFLTIHLESEEKELENMLLDETKYEIHNRLK